MTHKRLLVFVALSALMLVHAAPARADEDDSTLTPDAGPDQPHFMDRTPPATAAEMAQARTILVDYLDAVKAKKWEKAKSYIHPKALQDMAAAKRRTGQESSELATWARARTDAYLTNYELGRAEPSGKGAVAIYSTEEEFDVQEKGTESGIHAEYLLIPLAGKWFVAGRRHGEGELFTADSVPIDYRGYFEGEYVAPLPSTQARDHRKREHRRRHG